MKMQVLSLRITGIICLFFLIFHLAFNKLFNWQEALTCLSQSDRAIMLTYHFISILILSFMTFILCFQPKTLLSSNLKYSVLGMFILFFTLRIITEFTQFGFSGFPSIIVIFMCGLPVLLTAIPLIYNPSKKH
jgi:hypothetical protein